MSGGMSDLLADIAARCNIRDEKVLRKSKELIALLHSKQGFSCSDTCKVVVCLELASSLSLCPLNREEAIKYSGCKKQYYVNIYNNISKLLNLDKIYSVKEICLLMGVSDIQNPTMKLFEKYKSTFVESDSDFEHPMYSCAAVLAFCRSNKIKLDIMKLVEMSRVKKKELDELAKKFEILIELKNDNENAESKKPYFSQFNETLESKGDNIESRKKKADTGVMTDDEYKEWKRKMLEE